MIIQCHGLLTTTFNSDKPIILIIDGRTYKTVKIGTQEWMAENLDYKFTYNNSKLPIGHSGQMTTPAGWYYNNDENTYGSTGNKYGLLYNWYAAKYLDDNKTTLLPNGWHVPTKADFDKLKNTINSATNDGAKLKSATGWNSGNGTDEYEFNAKPAGYRPYDVGRFSGIGKSTRYKSIWYNSRRVNVSWI